MDIEVVLVDQVVLHEDRGEVGTAARQISARLRLEPYDLLDDDAPHDGDVPVGPLQGPGELESPTPTALRGEGESEGE